MSDYCSDNPTQSATSHIYQNQYVTQQNTSEQGVALSVAIGTGSSARSSQLSNQTNANSQSAYSNAENVSTTAEVTNQNAPNQMTDKDSEPRTIHQDSQDLEGMAIAISIDGGYSEANQSYQLNQTNQRFRENKSYSDLSHPPNTQGRVETNDLKDLPIGYKKVIAEPTTADEKATIAIDHKGQRYIVQVLNSGEILLNGKSITN